ncbi:snRNA-activating protein complex subunit 5-like isoform X1 [Littorina saxatilis]|uniref:snRNA-activating protein complex subunit 5-like isoform X1 n=1 Tax=Littorina saxatilis TaxID=31220 RepID=UPI0038B57DC2
MSKYRELALLQEQEKTLMELHMSFGDQLNRLKVEELALTNLLRLQKEREIQAQTGVSDTNTEIGPAEEAIERETMEVLDLLVSENPDTKEEEEEEEEEDEEEEDDDDEEEEEEEDKEADEEGNDSQYNDQLTNYLEDLLHEQQEMMQLGVMEDEQEEEEEDEDT